MKEGWEYKKLGDICDILNGYAFDSKSFTNDSKYPSLIRIRDVKRGYSETYYNGIYDNEYIVQKGDYLICMDGEFNIGKWNSNPSLLNQRVCKITPKPNFLKDKYILYFLPSILKKIEAKSDFVTVKHLSSKQIINIDIPVPPIPIQQQIVSHLDKLNEILDKLHTMLQILNKTEQAIYYDMFYTRIWTKINLSSMITMQKGLVDPNIEPYSNMIHVGVGNITPSTGKIINTKLCREENLISGKYFFNSDMVLYSKIRPNLNKVALPECDGVCSADMYPLIPQNNTNRIFLKYVLTQNDFVDYAVSQSGRANIPKINREALLAYKSILPPLSLQQTFAERITTIEMQKQKITTSIAKFQEMLDGAMENYFGD